MISGKAEIARICNNYPTAYGGLDGPQTPCLIKSELIVTSLTVAILYMF